MRDRRRRQLSIAALVVAVYLAVSAAPVAAANVAVISNHTTASDFQSGTLDNAEVERSGEPAFVGYGTYDSSATARYAMDYGSGSTSYDHVGNHDGSINGATWTAGKSGQALEFAGDGDRVSLPNGVVDSSGLTISSFARLDTYDGSGYQYLVYPRGDVELIIGERDNVPGADISVYDGSWHDTGAEWDTGSLSHVAVTHTGSEMKVYKNGSLIYNTSSTLNSDSIGNSIGAADGGSNAWDGTIDETRFYSSPLSPGEVSRLAKYPNGKLTPDNGNSTYTGDWHDVSNASSVHADLELDNMTANVRVEATGPTTLASQTFTSSGNKTLSIDGAGYDQVRVVVEMDNSSQDHIGRLHAEGVSAQTSDPTIDASSLSPNTTSESVGSLPVTLAGDISDQDFSLVQGDSLTLEWFVDGQKRGETTASSNTTASFELSEVAAGEHTWHVTATDSYGNSVTSATAEFSSPSEIRIYNESAPNNLVDNAQIEITAYYGNETLRRNTTTGVIDLTGFPTGEPITIRTTADNYTTRTVVLESVYQQSSVFLLNQSTPTYQVRFDLQDPTGKYAMSDTVLFVERDLKQNGSVEWRTIAGDNFGVQGVPVDLRQNERYRLRIKNLDTGTTATIGSFTAIQSETVTLSPGSATIQIRDSEKEYGWEVTENETAQYILFEYDDTEEQTSSVKLTIHERFNKSNVLVDNVTYNNANEIVHQESLTANQTNQTWVAEIYVDRGNGYMQFRETVGGPSGSIIPIELDDTWRTAIGVFVLLISGMAFSQLNRSTGPLGTALVGGMLWQIGLLSTVTTGSVVALAIGITVVNQYKSGGGF